MRLALAPLTRRIAYLRDGDWTVVDREGAQFFDIDGEEVQREVKLTRLTGAAIGKGNFRHFMEKELHEHPAVIGDTLHRMVNPATRAVALPDLPFDFATLPRITMSACGSALLCRSGGAVVVRGVRSHSRPTSMLPANFAIGRRRCRRRAWVAGVAVGRNGRHVGGAALYARAAPARAVGVERAGEHHGARERRGAGDRGGTGDRSRHTKAFTAQLSVLACLALAAARARGAIDAAQEAAMTDALLEVPSRAAEVLDRMTRSRRWPHRIAQARDVLYLGRGNCFPIALEGALKLKEISYIHAEGYAAGEMKHGPIALIDPAVPVIAIAPSGPLFEKTASNLQEAAARGGQVIVFSDAAGAAKLRGIAAETIVMPAVDPFVAPILYAIPVQLLAYHVAVLKGTDVDQPRNLAKSVTVE